MCSVSLKLPLILCLRWTALVIANKGIERVQWKETGDSLTIQCRSSHEQDSLNLRWGLKEEREVFYFDGMSKTETISGEFAGRLQTRQAGKFPNMDIVIKNVSQRDTGPYWCKYKNYSPSKPEVGSPEDNGSVLLVVKDKAMKCGSDMRSQDSDIRSQDMILVSFVIVGAILLLIIIVLVVLIVQKKLKSENYTPEKPRRVPSSDVYEDMRSTIRHGARHQRQPA